MFCIFNASLSSILFYIGDDMKIGFFGLLGILFIALKLMGVITWSWLIVLLPVYGPFLLVFSIVLLTAILHALK